MLLICLSVAVLIIAVYGITDYEDNVYICIIYRYIVYICVYIYISIIHRYTIDI